MLVQAIGAPFAPEEFKDAYREGVERLIARKLERKEVAASAPAQEPAAAPVVNIIDVLRKSLELAKKAVRTEVEVARRKPERATEAKSSEGKSKAQRRKA